MKFAVFLMLAGSAVAADHASLPYFKVLDRDGDQEIRPAEVQRSAWLARIDTDKNGTLNAAEFAAGWDEHALLRGTLAQLFPDLAGYPKPGTPAVTEQAQPRQAAKILPAAEQGIGTLIADLSVTPLTGSAQTLSAYAKGKPLFIAAISTSCPISKRYLPTLLALEKDYAARGVTFLYVAPRKTDADTDLRAALPTATILRDPDGTLLKTLGATSSTDCFLLDARRTLQYRGAVDDQYGLGYSLDAPRVRLLSRALDAVLAGAAPEIAATEAPGCALDLADAKPAALAKVTYHNRISRIVQQNCQECHRKGGVAPFALGSYEEVIDHAGMIRKMVDQRLMPPWFAAPPAAGQHTVWANDRTLPERDRTDLLAWIAGGKPLGEAADAPLPRTWTEGEWSIGKPDSIVQIPEPIAVKATGTMPYQQVRVPTDFGETRYVTAVEVLPTARDVVHHVLVFADAPSGALPGIARAIRRGQGRGGNEEEGGFFAIYVPGNNTLVYPEGFAKALPANATLRFQIHYTPNGTATQDQVRVGMKFAKEPPPHLIQNIGIQNNRFSIPPGAANHPVEARIPVPREAVVLAFLPHMHLRGKAWRYELVTPDGQTRTLLDVPHYDFNWQLVYRFAEPLTLAAGSSIKATAWFDNSTGNPANPDPNKTVRWGPQTSDEMMLGYVEYYLPKKSSP